MKIQFRSPTPDGAMWREAAIGRVRQALYRLDRLVGRVKVRLDAARGDGRGPDKRCQVQVDLPDGRSTRLDVRARSWPSALETATRRVRAKVLGTLHRAVVPNHSPALQPALARVPQRALGLRRR
jgi:hypothetical protein